MRSRILDLVLLVGLVAVAGGIMWTLFNLGGSPRQTTPPGGQVSGSVQNGSGSLGEGNVVPVVPEGSGGAGGVVPIDPNAGQAGGGAGAGDAAGGNGAAGDGAAAGNGADGAQAGQDGAGADATPVTPPPPRILPDGSVELERVGFSYVTGGAGACGVVLEAWQHVAVSRDLLAEYGCGATVTVTLDDPAGGRSQVLGVIGDTMNPVHSNTVNVYVGEDEDALAYGVTTGTLVAR